MLRRAFLAAALSASVGVSAETAYVTDSLRLGLHLEPDTSDRPFENLVSGTAVEILEHNTNYARVRLADSREGWVKAMFLVTLKPAAARVAELEAEITGLQGAVTTAQAAEHAAVQELARLTGEVQSTTGSAEAIEETVLRLQIENRAHEERLEADRGTLPLVWVVPALVVALVAGFLAGLWWLDSLIRRRHGGFRVY
jgi:SH3 domain protein